MPGFLDSVGRAVDWSLTPLVDLPDQYFRWGGPVGRAVENTLEGFTSPLGLATAPLGFLSGGSTLGLTGGLGRAAVAATRAGTAVGADLGANLAANAANGLLPENTNPMLRAGAVLGAGFLGGGAATAGIGKGLYEATPTPRPVKTAGVKPSPNPTVPMDVGGIAKGQELLTKGGRLYSGPLPGVDNAFRMDVNRVARGKDALLSRINLEKAVGKLDQLEADIGQRFINVLPEKYLSGLGSSYSTKGNQISGMLGGNLAGYYTPADSLITMIKSATNPTTIAHEVAHHLEAFIEPKDVDRLRKVWRNRIEPQYQEYTRMRAAMEADLNRLTEDTPEYWLLVERIDRLDYDTPYAVKGGFNEWLAETVSSRSVDQLLPEGKVTGGIVDRARKTFDDVTRALSDAVRSTDTRTPDRVYDNLVTGKYPGKPLKPAFERDGKPSEPFMDSWMGERAPQNPEQAKRFEEMRKLREANRKPIVSQSPIHLTEQAVYDHLRNKVTAAIADGDEQKIRDATSYLERFEKRTGRMPETPPQDVQPLQNRYTPEATLDMVQAAVNGQSFAPNDAEYMNFLIENFLTSQGVSYNEFLKRATDEEWQYVTEQLLESLKLNQS